MIRGWRIPILGVTVGKSPSGCIEQYAPAGFDAYTTLNAAREEYNDRADYPFPFKLDPYYENKAVPFLRPGDLFWVIACRKTERGANGTRA
jgi:hypothetical protein